MKNMKKFAAALIVMSLILALASTAFAYKEEAVVLRMKFTGSAWGYEKVTNQHGVNKTDVAFRKGTVWYAVAKKGNWYKMPVLAEGGDSYDEYWFNGDYLKKVSEDTPLKLVYSSGGYKRTIEYTLDAKVKYAKYKTVKVQDGRRVNIRKGPGLTYASLGRKGKGHGYKLYLHKDHMVVTDSRGVDWLHVKAYNGDSWVSMEYIDRKTFKK